MESVHAACPWACPSDFGVDGGILFGTWCLLKEEGPEN